MEVKKSLSLELCKQATQLGFGATALAILVLINSNIHQLVICMMKEPIDHVITAPPSYRNCSSHSFPGHVDLRIVMCEQSTLTFHLDGSVLRLYSAREAKDLRDWLRRCTREDYKDLCHFNKTSNLHCYNKSSIFKSDYLCFNDSFKRDYLVIGGFRLTTQETDNVISYLASV